MGARLLLLLSAFSPLVILIAIRVDSWALTWVLLAIGAVAASALPMVVVTARRLAQPGQMQVKSAANAANELSGYLATYILPFVTLGAPNVWDITAYAVFAIFLAAAYLQSGKLAVNPWLLFFKYKIYDVSMTSGNELVISRNSLTEGDELTVVRLAAGLSYQTGVKQ